MWNTVLRRWQQQAVQRVAHGLLAGVVALTAFLPLNNQVAQASGAMPSALFDPDEVGWASVRNYSATDFQNYFDDRAEAGYMLIDLEVAEISGKARYSGVFQENLDGREWAAKTNLTHSEFSANWTAYKNAGFRLIDQESYVLNGNRYYAGIWIKNLEGLSWASYRNVSSAEFSEKFDVYADAGYMPVDAEGYRVGDGVKYSAVWVKNVENVDWILYRDMTAEQYADKFNAYRDEFRVHHVQSYRRNGVQNYLAIWIRNENGRGWYAYRDMTANGFSNRWAQMRDLGYRLTGFEIYETADGLRYAGVWRQSTKRPDWPLKDEVDKLLEEHFEEHDIPGMSVAIARRGEFVYLRGFGDADVANDKWANSRTVYRLASISKAIAGVLTMQMVEANEFDLDDASSDYIEDLPGHHTHTIEQVVSNRAGIGHYDELGSWNDDYETATEAAELFWNEPLVYTPGTNCMYSTHGYTILGAAMEGATGKTINQIVRDEITVPLNLPTLRVEDRSVPDANRSKVYNTDNSEATADDTSWKVLGGGLEASAYDLARFGMKLMDGEIIVADSLNTLWTPPDGCDSYALGWGTETEDGTQAVWKDGLQLGSRTYIRMYPEKEIVIVVLTNRKDGGHSPISLGKAIGAMMLDAEPPTRLPTTPVVPIQPIPVERIPKLLEPVEEIEEIVELPDVPIDVDVLLPEEESPAPENEVPVEDAPEQKDDETVPARLYLPAVSN